MEESKRIYKPSKWIVLFLLFSAFFASFLIFMIAEASIVTDLLGMMTGILIIALIEVSISYVAVKESTIIIKGFFKPYIINLSEVSKVKAEGARVVVFFKSGNFKKMPFWFGSKLDFQKIINSKLKQKIEN